jgi:outer membrane protein TolC
LNRKKETQFLRESIINLQQAIRNYQEREDQLKLSLRSAIRSIERVLENYKIQKNSLDLAKRRVERANLLLKAGRIEIRDLLEAQESFVLSQNALTDTVVNFRINQWSLQRDIGKLSLNQFL